MTTIQRAPLLFAAALGCHLSFASEPRDARTGIPIRTRFDGATFPVDWLGGRINAVASPLNQAEAARSVRVAEQAMSLYPVGLLLANLKAVYFVKEMSFYGLRYGGTNSDDAVYITNRGAKSGFSDDYLRSTFHHEFSSILLRNFPSMFDAKRWAEVNRGGVGYRSSGADAIKSGTADTSYRTVYNLDGFLNQYATASIEEDFNTVAEGLFAGDAQFWRIADMFPRVERKKDLAVAFYSRLDTRFTEEFFRSLAR